MNYVVRNGRRIAVETIETGAAQRALAHRCRRTVVALKRWL
jgi:hypothetical protein